MPYYIKKKPSATKKSGLRLAVQRLDKIFSLYIRLRDSRPFAYRQFRCISCGQIKPFDKADCGHFFSRTHMNTRFDEDNAHAECSYCNRFSADHLVSYEENLIRKIGRQRFDLLRLRAHQTRKWSAFELQELEKFFKSQIDKFLSEK